MTHYNTLRNVLNAVRISSVVTLLNHIQLTHNLLITETIALIVTTQQCITHLCSNCVPSLYCIRLLLYI